MGDDENAKVNCQQPRFIPEKATLFFIFITKYLSMVSYPQTTNTTGTAKRWGIFSILTIFQIDCSISQ